MAGEESAKVGRINKSQCARYAADRRRSVDELPFGFFDLPLVDQRLWWRTGKPPADVGQSARRHIQRIRVPRERPVLVMVILDQRVKRLEDP